MSKDPDYDPVARRERYLRTRELKGRKPAALLAKVGKPDAASRMGQGGTSSSKTKNATRAAATEKMTRLTKKVAKLNKALVETRRLLREKEAEDRRSETLKRAAERREDRENSDGKTTAKERAAAKDYREKNKTKIAAKRKEAAEEKRKSPKDMSTNELQAREDTIMMALSSAKKQIRQTASDIRMNK